MTKQTYRGKELDVLLAHYTEQAAGLRDVYNYEFKWFSGYLTLQLALAGWLTAHPINGQLQRIGIFCANIALLIVCTGMINGLRSRRREIRTTIRNINTALGFYEVGAYVQGIAISPEPPSARRFLWHMSGCLIGFAGSTITLFASL